jgi:NAD(P)-dependent dehydrogenase (short-subunit alcohol dehydrogenase family)
MDLNLDGKIAWIAGGTGWLGQATARALAAEGACVVISSRREDACRALADEITAVGGDALALALDTTEAGAAEAVAGRIVEARGRIDVLVNSMSINAYGPFLELDRATFQAALDAKYFGYIACMQAALPVMLDQGAGAIVSISGTGGKMPIAVHMAGGSINAALDLIVRGLANEHAGSGIRINTIAPGPITSPRQVARRAAGENVDSAIELIPMGRFGEAGEVADAVLFLASERTSYVTGAVFYVDGGGVLTT